MLYGKPFLDHKRLENTEIYITVGTVVFKSLLQM